MASNSGQGAPQTAEEASAPISADRVASAGMTKTRCRAMLSAVARVNRGRAMPTLQRFPAGGYRFISHQFQYSGGIAAEPGFRIERARFTCPLPLAEGFDAIEAYLAGIGRSPTAFCACELRSPAQFTDAGFVAFNRHYVERLAAWGIFRDEINPVARSNVCPELDPPATPSFFAFSYTVPGQRGGFVVAGSGEAPEGRGNYRDHIVRRGDLSQEGLREKARWVLGEQERRLRALG